MFYYGWPSWAVELGSGLVVATLVQPVPLLLPRVLFAVLLSVFYESVLDPNGWSWMDVGQRAVGIAAGLMLWSLIRG